MSDRMEDERLMDAEHTRALEMTREELLARKRAGRPVEVERVRPTSVTYGYSRVAETTATRVQALPAMWAPVLKHALSSTKYTMSDNAETLV